MKKQLSSVLGLAALATVTVGHAQDEVELTEPRLTNSYLSVMGTYSDPDEDRNLLGGDIDHGGGVSVLYGWTGMEGGLGFEVQGFYETLETGDDFFTDYYRYGASGDLVYSFGDRLGFTPFLLIGGGGNYNDVIPDDADEIDWFANGGVGFVTGPIFKTGNIRLRAEARYVYDSFEEEYEDIRYALGIEIPLYRDEKVAPPPPPEPVKVVETVEVVKEVSTGVLDSDGDGVVDDKDECPDTPEGTRVDGVGCPLDKIIRLDGVTFEFDKTRLRPDAKTILDNVLPILTKYPDMKVEVAGHTDSKGSDSYNQKLSEGRALAVRDYFESQGIPATQLSVKGYGEAEPVADNETEEGRELNRRTELRILN